MLIGDCHDDANRDEEEGSDGKGEDQTIPWKMDRVVLCDEEADAEHENKGEKIPDQGYVRIACHETVMHIGVGGSYRSKC